MDVRHSAGRVRRAISRLIVFGVLILLGYCGFVVMNHVTKYRPVVTLGKGMFTADVAKSKEELERGLAGRQELEKDKAMLFVFGEDRPWPMWMKGMRIPIDIIWLDADKKVVHIESNIWPDAEPHETYRPPVNARYVLETRAGAATEFSITKGKRAEFKLEREE